MGTTRSFRLVLACIGASSLGLCLASCSTSTTVGSQTRLDITIRADGSEISQQYLLECDGEQSTDASTLPDASKACLQLALDPSVITEEIDPQQACTEIYGGPKRAEIEGTLHGDPVNANFSRHNGCAIERWESASFLLGSVNS